jgi:hypothetical protein
MKASKFYAELIRIGGMMSNVCYNGKNAKDMPESYKRSMSDLQQQWDDELTRLRTEEAKIETHRVNQRILVKARKAKA